jgi:PBP1b-binding outer membrane lipoprotein LpoB
MRHGGVMVLLATILTASGCGAPMQRVDPDQDDALGGTGVDSADVRQTADKIARSIVAMPTIFARGTPYVVVQDPQNQTRFPINDSMIVDRLVTLLVQNSGGRIQFVDRDNWELVQKERQLKRSGAVSVPTDGSGQPNLAAAPLGSDYFLTSTLKSLSKDNGELNSDYIVVTFKLTDSETGALVWQDDHEWKKVGEKGVIYR